MGWNDHDDRLYAIMEELETLGVPYPHSNEIACVIRMEDMSSDEDIPFEYLSDLADDYHAGEPVYGSVKQ